MSWVRIHDGAMTHPKIVGLSDKAFRLWIWGLSYSQQHLTDGLVVSIAIPRRLVRAIEDLTAAALWERADAGFRIHDYLDWNDSREIVLAKRKGIKRRVEQHRSNALQGPPVKHISTSGVGIKSSLEENKDDEIGERAGRFVERYEELYSQHRKGAKWFRRQPNLDWQRAINLCRTWDDARLEKLAVLCLTTDDDWISQTDRGLAVFESKATFLDDLLTKWESQQTRSVS